MRRHRLRPAASTLLVLVLGLAAACAPRGHGPLRVGLNTWPGYEFLYLAEVKGFFADEGLKVRLLEFGSLSDTRRAYERGQLDVMGATLVETLVARDQSTRSPQVVRVIDYSAGADVLVAQPWIRNSATLKGARVGVEYGALPVYLLARGLEHLGLGMTDIRTQSMDQSAMEAAFRRGELDALVTYPPTSVRLARDVQTTTLFSSAAVPREILDLLIVEADVVAARPDDVTALLRAFDRAQAFAVSHPAEAYALMGRREGISGDEFAAALTDGVVLVTPADQPAYFAAGGPLATAVDRANRLLRATGQIRGADRRAGLITDAFSRGARQ